MATPQHSGVTLRAGTLDDAPACGQICFDAFSTIARMHGFPPDIPTPEIAVGLLSSLFSSPGFYCVVAEHKGRIVGSNCLDERSVITGVGPITVDPATQNLGVGRLLMQSVIDRAIGRGAPGIRFGTSGVPQPLALPLLKPRLRYPRTPFMHAGPDAPEEHTRMPRTASAARRRHRMQRAGAQNPWLRPLPGT